MMLIFLILRCRVWICQTDAEYIDKRYNVIESINWNGFSFYVMIYAVIYSDADALKRESGANPEQPALL